MDKRHLDELTLALRKNSRAKSALDTMNEEYARNKSLRDTPFTQANKYGYTSPLQSLSEGLMRFSGQRNIQANKAGRADALQQVGATEHAFKLYQAGAAARKVAQDQTNFDATAAALPLAAQAKLRGARASATTLAGVNKASATALDERKVTAAGLTATAKEEGRQRDDMYVQADGTGSINVYHTDKGPINTATGEPVDLSGMMTVKNYTLAVNKLKKAGGKGKDGDPMDKVGAPDLVTQVLDNPLLQDATGTFNPKRWAGKFGLDAGDIPILGGDDNTSGERIQALQSKMSDIGIDSVKTNLKGLGVNPTDKDLEVAFASIPDAGTSPLAWSIWTKDQYLPMLRKAGAKGVVDGTITQAKLDAYMSQVEASVEASLAKYGGEAPAIEAAAAAAPAGVNTPDELSEMSIEELRALAAAGAKK